MESQRRSSVGFRMNVIWNCNNAMPVHNSSFLTRVILMVFAASLVHPACGRPVSNDQYSYGRRGVYEGLSEQSQIDGTKYLMTYGYLPGSDLETGALRTDEELQRAIRHFQKFAHIPETGRLDENTMEAMRRPRCGMADLLQDHGYPRHTDGEIGPPSGYMLGPSKWQKKWLTIRLLNFTPDLNYQHTRDAIIRALYVWSDVTELSFHEIQTGHADIYMQFSSGYHQDGYPFDGPGMVLAHAFFPGDERGGDIHFDEDERWTIRSDQGVNLFMVAAHELGHSLGLAHSNVPGSLMFPWHQGYTPDFKLHPDDITAIQYLYGPKKPPQKPPLYPSSTSSTHRPPHHPAPTYPASTHRPHYPQTHPPVPTAMTSREPFSSSTPPRQWPVPSSTSLTSSTTSETRTSTVAPVVTTHKQHGHGGQGGHGGHDGHGGQGGQGGHGGHNGHDGHGGQGGHDGHGGHNGHGGHGGHGRPSSTTARPLSDPSIPDPCRSIDALSVIRGETFLFSGKWFWRINDRGVMDGFPVQISRFWYGFPSQVQNVDALYERSSDGKIIFFSGNKYWEFNGNYLVGGLSAESGKPISDFGLPADVDHIDAAFVWGHNRRTYVINGDMYWKLNETGHGIETYNYPRDMSMWTGVSLPVDAAFTYTDGHTYFFKDSEYWQFNNARMHVRHGYPKPIGDKWLKCEPRDTATELSETATKVFAAQQSGKMSQIVPLPVAIIIMLLMAKIMD